MIPLSISGFRDTDTDALAAARPGLLVEVAERAQSVAYLVLVDGLGIVEVVVGLDAREDLFEHERDVRTRRVEVRALDSSFDPREHSLGEFDGGTIAVARGGGHERLSVGFGLALGPGCVLAFGVSVSVAITFARFCPRR